MIACIEINKKIFSVDKEKEKRKKPFCLYARNKYKVLFHIYECRNINGKHDSQKKCKRIVRDCETPYSKLVKRFLLEIKYLNWYLFPTPFMPLF